VRSCIAAVRSRFAAERLRFAAVRSRFALVGNDIPVRPRLLIRFKSLYL
jgi:hypothetical protein